MNTSKSRYSLYSFKPETILLNNLALLGLNSQNQLKVTIEEGFLGKDNPKAVFFILYNCIKKMISTQQAKVFQGWYPPRTVSDQIEFKKICISQIQKLQLLGKIPRNFVLSKTIIDQYNGQRIIEFLRYLSEFALRSIYLTEYNQVLIQVSPFNKTMAMKENENLQDINRFYPYLLSPEVPEIDDEIFEILEAHIDLTRKNLLQKSLNDTSIVFPQDELINSVFYLQQMKKKLATKVPKEFFSENRAFDRTQIIDKTRALWKDIDISVQSLDITNNEALPDQDEWIQLDNQWQKWVKKISNQSRQLQLKQLQEDPLKQQQRLKKIKITLIKQREELQQWRRKVIMAMKS